MLDDTDIGTVLVHQRGERMTKQMTGSGFVHCALDISARQVRQMIAAQRFAVFADKYLFNLAIAD